MDRDWGEKNMGAQTDVIMISGFLGSGKTTLLNGLLKSIPGGYRVVVLMNEFGEIGIDGPVLQGEDFDILEINRGSIFCICVKRDFITALNKIASEVKPDVLIMEPTGVANPGDLKSDFMLPFLNNRFRLLEQICILDFEYFEEAYGAFVSVEKQIASSSLFVINKVDVASREKIERIKQVVRGHHPSPQFMESVFCNIPFDSILRKMGDAGGICDASGQTAGKPLSSKELDEVLSLILSDPFREVTPPDNLMSSAYSWRGDGIAEFREFLNELPKGVVRGKGFLKDAGKTYLLNMVMGNFSIGEFHSPVHAELLGKVVLIFPPDLEETVAQVAARWRSRLEELRVDPGGDCGPASFEKSASVSAQ
ncbi:MAG: GTP-binding protein [Syntrophobacteraceae bacterium]